MLKLKRAYDPVWRDDGMRFLVERLWPRGLSKSKLQLDAWLKDVGPTTRLRRWFSHDPDKWVQFRARYFRELDSRPESWQPILSATRRRTVTLVYSSHDEEHNNAVALKEYLQREMRRGRPQRRRPSRQSIAPGRGRRAWRHLSVFSSVPECLGAASPVARAHAAECRRPGSRRPRLACRSAV